MVFGQKIKAKKFEEVSLTFNYPLDSSGSSRLTFLDPQKSRINSGAADELGVREVLAAKDNSDAVVYNPVRKYTDGVDEANVTALNAIKLMAQKALEIGK